MSKLITCEVCSKQFEKQNKRGRPPKVCPSCKEKQAKRAETRKIEKEQANENGLTPVPVFSRAESPEEFSVGEVVYILPSFVKGEVSQRRFAKEYKIKSIEGQMVEVVRHQKTHYVQHPAKTHFSRLLKKSGVEYMDIAPESVIMENEGIDD